MSNTDNKTQALFGDVGSDLLVKKDEQRRCMGCMEEFSAEFDLCPNCGYVVGTQSRLKCYLQPGLWLAGNYMLGKVIGQGGFGITYIAWDKKNERKVAVKEFFPNSLSTRETGETHVICYNDKAATYFKDGVKKMLEEGVRLSSFRENENIVTVYDYFEENSTAYIVMEYLEGKSLKDYAEEKGGKLDPEEAVTLILPVLNALSAMHNENLIHRDIAPDNIYLCDDGRIKLLDFGSARIAVQDANKSLSVMVKPGYAPKEQYVSRSKQGPWTDVYSVCATLYKLITGEAPVESVERDITPLKTFDSFEIKNYQELEKIIVKGLKPEPEDRISSADDLSKMLTEEFECVNSSRRVEKNENRYTKNQGKQGNLSKYVQEVKETEGGISAHKSTNKGNFSTKKYKETGIVKIITLIIIVVIVLGVFVVLYEVLKKDDEMILPENTEGETYSYDEDIINDSVQQFFTEENEAKEVQTSVTDFFEETETVNVTEIVDVVENETEQELYNIYTGTCPNGLQWSIDSNWTMHIWGNGKMGNSISGALYKLDGTDSYLNENGCAKVKEVIIYDGVESIGDYAFLMFKNLENVSISSTVKSIGEMSFDSLKLTEIIIPDGVESVGFSAFLSCENVKSITVPYSVTKVSAFAFPKYATIYVEGRNSAPSGWNKLAFGENNKVVWNA